MDKSSTKYVSTSNRLLLAFIVLLYAIPIVLFVEDMLGLQRNYYSYIIEFGVVIGLALLTDWVYISIHKKTHRSAPKYKPIIAFNISVHRICLIIIIAIWPLRLPLLFIDHSEWNRITTFDVWILVAFITLIILDRLYKIHYIYLYTALLTASLSIYYIALISELMNADSLTRSLSKLFIVIASIPIILLLYKIPIKVLKKHNKAINHDAL